MTDIDEVLQNVRRLKKGTGKSQAPTRQKNQKVHARRRLEQRYGLKVTSKEYASMCRIIQEAQNVRKAGTDQAVLIERKDARVTKWLLSWGEERLFCLYDKKTHRIRTFLAPGMK